MKPRTFVGLLLLGLFACQSGFAGLVVVSADFQTGGGLLFNGVESLAAAANPAFDAANIWNGLGVPYLSPATLPLYPNLQDSQGNATNVGFQFMDPVDGYCCGSPSLNVDLFGDFVYLNGGALNWRITGLLPNTTAHLYVYDTYNGPDSGLRGFTMDVQGTNYLVDGNTGAYVSNILVDGDGVISGSMIHTAFQGSWAGFQLATEGVPEPSALMLFPIGIALLVVRRRWSR
jgi:hypothetical protein